MNIKWEIEWKKAPPPTKWELAVINELTGYSYYYAVNAGYIFKHDSVEDKWYVAYFKVIL